MKLENIKRFSFFLIIVDKRFVLYSYTFYSSLSSLTYVLNRNIRLLQNFDFKRKKFRNIVLFTQFNDLVYEFL